VAGLKPLTDQSTKPVARLERTWSIA